VWFWIFRFFFGGYTMIPHQICWITESFFQHQASCNIRYGKVLLVVAVNHLGVYTYVSSDFKWAIIIGLCPCMSNYESAAFGPKQDRFLMVSLTKNVPPKPKVYYQFPSYNAICGYPLLAEEPTGTIRFCWHPVNNNNMSSWSQKTNT